jgi:hypothetical protein
MAESRPWPNSGRGILSQLIREADEFSDANNSATLPENASVMPDLQLARMRGGGLQELGSGPWDTGPAFNQSSTSASRIPVGYAPVRKPWWLGPPGPPILDEWQRQFEKGTTGLYNYFRSFGGSRSSNGGDDYCHDRWEKELEYCEQFRPFGYRYYKGCTDRARYRHNLCVRNGGKPDPNEPDPYGWNDIPRDDADR